MTIDLPDAALLPLIRAAIADPGSIVPRREPEFSVYESTPDWQARAVVMALMKAGSSEAKASVPGTCPIETVFPDGRIPCTLNRGHEGKHVFGEVWLPL